LEPRVGSHYKRSGTLGALTRQRSTPLSLGPASKRSPVQCPKERVKYDMVLESVDYVFEFSGKGLNLLESPVCETEDFTKV